MYTIWRNICVAAATTAAGLTYFHHGRPIVFQDGKWQVFDAPIGCVCNKISPTLQQLLLQQQTYNPEKQNNISFLTEFAPCKL